MSPVKKDPKREDRISDEIIVDAYGPEEQAVGWFGYLDSTLHFPFRAKCIAERATSPLRKGVIVEIVGLSSESDGLHEMFVEIPWEKRTLAIPLGQVKPVAETDAETKEAVADWHYWLARGYEL
jgi:hypothetical protein